MPAELSYLRLRKWGRELVEMEKKTDGRAQPLPQARLPLGSQNAALGVRVYPVFIASIDFHLSVKQP